MYYGTSIQLYINAEKTKDFLTDRGYTLITIGDLFLDCGYKTKKEVREKLYITETLLSSVIAFKPESRCQMETAFADMVEIIKDEIKSGYVQNKNYHRAGTYFMHRRKRSGKDSTCMVDYSIDHVVKKELYKTLKQHAGIPIPYYYE